LFEISVKESVINAVASLMRRRFDVTGERDKQFGQVTVDLYLPEPLNCAVQFDDAVHCTRERAATFVGYPPNTPLNFDVRRYQADQTPGSAELARQDMQTDLIAGLNPTVRIRYDETEELPGTLEERIEHLLSKRFAYHAGTTFHLMLENAGAKPHRTL
jgi:hypothetical protein